MFALFKSLDHQTQWHDGMDGFEPISGERPEPGAITRLLYLKRGKRQEIVETILRWQPPEALSVVYNSTGLH